MKTISLISIIFFCFGAAAQAQDAITGTFVALGNQQVKLVGFDGFNTYVIDRAKANMNGSFLLPYGDKDYGMGYLEAEDEQSFIVILAPDENLRLEGEHLATAETVEIVSGKQNQLFEQYASEHPRRQQALSAWIYLDALYRQDALFAGHEVSRAAIEKEIQRIREEDEAFLAGLDSETYVSWFLPVRKLVSSVPTIAQYRTVEIPDAIAAFREMDHTDARLWKSGLLRETIEAHFWLIENSGRSLDSVYVEMHASIDRMMESLAADKQKFNEITGYLFKLLEERSLFGASEYLALKVLNEASSITNESLAARLEIYRAMRIGNTTPDFAFPPGFLAPGYQEEHQPHKLSDLDSQYTVVVFGASRCAESKDELLKIAGLYDKWQHQGVEVVYVSLDETRPAFRSLVADLPFISISDFRQWESEVVKAYHVFETPTMYLLDGDREILLRPNSVRQMDAWVDWFLVQGNR